MGRFVRSVARAARAGRIFENLFITGSTTGEGYGSTPGDLRAFDIVTGKLVWTFHTIPHPGEFGYDTWPEGAYKWAGGANAWGEISIDETRGIAYFPLGSADARLVWRRSQGRQPLCNSLLALDARTGKRLWHFQTIHHDIWDYDLTTAPKLLTIRRNGKNDRRGGASDEVRPALRLRSRHRTTASGRSRSVRCRRADVPGEATWPTQPYPNAPPAVCAAEVRPRRHQPAPRRGRTSPAARDPSQCAQRGAVHAADARSRSDLDPRRAGRIELGRQRRGSDDRHALRADCRSAGDSSTASPRHWRRLAAAARSCGVPAGTARCATARPRRRAFDRPTAHR